MIKELGRILLDIRDSIRLNKPAKGVPDEADARKPVSMIFLIGPLFMDTRNKRPARRMFFCGFQRSQRVRKWFRFGIFKWEIGLIRIGHQQNVFREALSEVLYTAFSSNSIPEKPPDDDLFVIFIDIVRKIGSWPVNQRQTLQY